MGYVDVGEEEHWGAERSDADEDEDVAAEPDAKRQKTSKQDKGATIFQDVCLSSLSRSRPHSWLPVGPNARAEVCHAVDKKKAHKVSKAAKQSIQKMFTVAAGESYSCTTKAYLQAQLGKFSAISLPQRECS